MKISTIKKVTEKYKRWVEYLAEEVNNKISNHFMHIAPQPLSTMSGLEQLMELLGINKKDMHVYVESMRNLRTYLRLIEKFPDFKRGELMTKEGYFTDVNDVSEAGKSGFVNYITESKKRLTR